MTVLSFIRSIDRRKCIYFAQRLLAMVLPLRPYYECGIAPRCPCPSARQSSITGVAVGDDIRMKIKV
jgi:hypothetical protein